MTNQARLDPAMETHTLANMDVGETAWTTPWAMWVDDERRCWLHPNYEAFDQSGGTVKMRVRRHADGYHVTVPHDYDYQPRSSPSYVGAVDGWLVVTAVEADAKLSYR